MSVTGFWILTTAADEQIRTWRERYADELAAAAKDREQGMAWWTGLGDVAFWEPDGRQGWQLTETGHTFGELFCAAASDGLADEVTNRAGAVGETGRLGVGARKGAPAAAFYSALGPALAARMPGCLGEFLLTSDEAVVARPEVERLLADADRGELVEQIDRWLDYGADGSASEGAEVVDGVVRVFREAVACGLGVAAAVVWF